MWNTEMCRGGLFIYQVWGVIMCANAISGIGLCTCSAVPLLKYLLECLSILYFSSLCNAFSSENLVFSSVRLYLHQFISFSQSLLDK